MYIITIKVAIWSDAHQTWRLVKPLNTSCQLQKNINYRLSL